MQRRTLLQQAGSIAIAFTLEARFTPSLRAQQATPAAGLATLGLPEVTIEVDDAGFTLPDDVSAGRTLLTVRNTGNMPLHFFAARVPDAVTDDQLASDMQADGEPAWFDMTTLTFLGTPDWPPIGGQAQGIVDLSAGRWILVDPLAGRDVAILVVGEGDETNAPEPVADVAIGMTEMAFSGLDAPIAAGTQIWKITNSGALEHELALQPVTAGTTNDDVIAMISSMLMGTPTPEVFAPIGGQGISSKGVTSWQQFDLAAGTYAAICMSPMPGADFEPHALEGMVQVFTTA
jgi:hypothetical protein